MKPNFMKRFFQSIHLDKALAKFISICNDNISPPEAIPRKRLHQDVSRRYENEYVALNANEVVPTKRQKLSDQYAVLVEETKMIDARLEEIDRKLERLAKLKQRLK